MKEKLNLIKALAAFQQEVPVIFKDTEAYGYKYADLPKVLEVINPLLEKHGLGFSQMINGKNIDTVVFHVTTGESIQSSTDIPQGVTLKGMNDFQVLGSAITYIRRYALSAMLGLVTDKDNDAHGEQEKKPQAPSAKPEPKKEYMTPNHVRFAEFCQKIETGAVDKLGNRITSAAMQEFFACSPEAIKQFDAAEKEFLTKNTK